MAGLTQDASPTFFRILRPVVRREKASIHSVMHEQRLIRRREKCFQPLARRG